MPGSYAHIALVNLASEKRALRAISGFPGEAIDAANLHSNFLELGCISPDYPYLDIASNDSQKWADAMHYTHTCQPIYWGAEHVRGLAPGLERDKCIAWLMGYAAHVITDMCIHPVVECKVGPYHGNETAHRRCEMHQDAYIFPRVGTGMPQTADHIQATILTCNDPDDRHKLDPHVWKMWDSILNKVYPDIYVTDPPDIDMWHHRCDEILEKLLPTSSCFIGFARHVCDGLGFAYPALDEIDKPSYVENLRVPAPQGEERRMHYDEIFDFAIKQVQLAWLDIAKYALGDGPVISYRNEEWDLDTGKNNLAGEAHVFWRV